MVAPIVRALYRDVMNKAEKFDNNAALKTLPKNVPDSSAASRITSDLFGSADAVAYKPNSRKATELAKEWFQRSRREDLQVSIREAFESIKVMNTLLKIEEAWNMQSCNVEQSQVPPLFSEAKLLPDSLQSIRPGTVLLAHPMLNLTLFRFSCVLITDHDAEQGTRGVIFNLPYTEHVQQQDCAVKFWHDDLSYSYLRDALIPFTEDMVQGTGFEGDFEGVDTEEPVAFDDTLVRQMQEQMWDTYGKQEGSKIDSVVSQILHSSSISPLIKDEGLHQNKQNEMQPSFNEAFNIAPKIGLNGSVMLHYGGPFEDKSSTFLLHDQNGHLAHSPAPIKPIGHNLFICHDTETMREFATNKQIHPEYVKGMQGCVLWEPGQLEKEIFTENLWFMSELPPGLVTHGSKDHQLMWMWSHTMKALGGEYRHLGNWYSTLLPNGRMMNMSSKQIAFNILKSLPKTELGALGKA